MNRSLFAIDAAVKGKRRGPKTQMATFLLCVSALPFVEITLFRLDS